MRRVPVQGAVAPRARRRRAPAAGAAGLAALLLASCATVPQREPAQWMGALPSNATLYASFSVAGAKPMLTKVLADAGKDFKDVASVADMTKRLVASVTLVKGAPLQFSVVALGSYPSGIIGMKLGGSKDWKKVPAANGVYWQWSKAGIQMSVPNHSLLLAANGGIEGLLAGWKAPASLEVPPEVADDMRSADLVVYMPELPGGLAEGAQAKGIHLPIQEVWVEAVKGQSGFDVSGTANTGSEKEARLLTLALKLGIVAWMRTEKIPNASEKLKAISVAPSGAQVKLTGLHLSDDEMVLLFTSVLKGLSPEQPAAQQEGDAGTAEGAAGADGVAEGAEAAAGAAP
jgi:hypothetical protein